MKGRLAAVLVALLVLCAAVPAAQAITPSRARTLAFNYQRSRCGNLTWFCVNYQVIRPVCDGPFTAPGHGSTEYSCWGRVEESFKLIFITHRTRLCWVWSHWDPWAKLVWSQKACNVGSWPARDR